MTTRSRPLPTAGLALARSLAALFAPLLLVACDAASVGEDASTPTTDGSRACTTDRECDDGVFCNGRERCEASGAETRCVAGAGTPCEASQTCIEAEARCRTECAVEEDADGDGARAVDCGGNDCDDSDPDVRPGAPELCDDVDQDCDPTTLGTLDADADGAISELCCNGERCGTDCDDDDDAVRPGQSESCNARDDDCDGALDEGVQRLFFPDLDGDGYGDRRGEPTFGCTLASGLAENTLDCDDTRAEAAPGRSERCLAAPDGSAIDEDCDGAIDETLAVALDCASRYGSPPHTSFACEDGACVVAPCPMGWGDCDDEPSTGCETDLTSTLAHCGTCGRSCGAGGECIAGACDRVVDVEAGLGFTCARRERADGTPTTTLCWGANDLGQLGDGTTRERTTPVEVQGLVGAIELAVTRSPTTTVPPDQRSSPFACARTEALALCWGSNELGRLGRGTGTGVGLTADPVLGLPDTRTSYDSGLPTTVRGTVTQLDVGATHACALERTNATDPRFIVQCWGENGAGQTGAGLATIATQSSAWTIDRYDTGKHLAAGALHTCVASTQDCPMLGCRTEVVDCIGSNYFYQLGSTDTAARSMRLTMSSDELAAGMSFTCSRFAGRVQCWGGNLGGSLGDGTTTPSSSPVFVLAPAGSTGQLTNVVQITAGATHACARLTDGSVACWGDNAAGQLGDGTTTQRTRPVIVSGLTDAIDVSAGNDHTCAVRAGGAVVCWGANARGQLGDGTTTRSLVPVPVAGL